MMYVEEASSYPLIESPSSAAEKLQKKASVNITADSLPNSPLAEKPSHRALPKVGGEEVLSPGVTQPRRPPFAQSSLRNQPFAQTRRPSNSGQAKVFESRVSESGNASLSQYDQALAKNQNGKISRQASVSSIQSRQSCDGDDDDDDDREVEPWRWNFGCLHPEARWFFVAYYDDDEQLIFDRRMVAMRYFRSLFWWDLLFTIPLDGIVIEGLGGPDKLETDTVLYIELLRFLRLGRLYRLFDFFATVDHKMIISQFSLVVLRNNTYIFFSCHWFACIIHFIARIELNEYNNSWIGRHIDRIEGQPIFIKYIYSLYYSVTAFTSVGDGDWYVATPPEAIAMTIFLIYTLVVSAYILGTITMLVVKNDEHSNMFRDRVTGMQ
eukprot:gene892-5686_t